jgi:phytanoyl-CoA hydroxylase
MLNATDHAAYARDGFVAHAHFFNALEVELLGKELARLQFAGRLRNVATAGDGITPSTTAMNLQICPVSPVSPVFRALPFADKVVEAVGGLLRTDFYLRLDQIFLKPGRHGAGTNWHQDNAYFRDGADHLADRGVGLWIALHPATIANGTMQVIPRRCLTTLDHRRDGGSDHHITCADRIDPADAVAIELPAGGALFFNWGVPHCTTGNGTDHERGALALHFQDLAYRPAGVMLGDRPNPVLRGPGADGGKETYGEDQRGRWEEMVAEGKR